MSQRNGSLLLSAAAIVFLVVSANAAYGAAPPAHMQAAQPASSPIKVDIRPTGKAYQAGQVVKMEVTLRDGYDHVVPSPGVTAIDIQEIDPTGKSSSETVTFAPGDKNESYSFQTNQPGFYQIVAREANAHLRQGSYLVVVSKASHQGSQGFLWERGITPAAVSRPVRLLTVALRQIPPQPAQESPSGNACPTPDQPCLLLKWMNDSDTLQADGTSAASFAVVYMSPDWSPAPADITVTLDSSGGDLQPKALTIQAGQVASNVATLTSKKAAGVDVWIQSSNPYYPFGLKDQEVKFAQAIWGIGLILPEKLPLVDTGTVTVQLLGPDKRPVETDKDIHVSLSLPNSKVRLQEGSEITIPKGRSSVSVSLVPAEIGKASVIANAASLPESSGTVDITGLAVILLCLAGGVVGGLCAFDAFKGSLFWRIFLGIVGGAVLTWLYVFFGLAVTHWTFAHSLTSTLFVSIVGGFMGLHVLNLAAKQMGFMTEEKPKA